MSDNLPAPIARSHALIVAPAHIVAYPHPFSRTPLIAQAPAGRLADMFAGLEMRVSLTLDGRPIPARDWPHVTARPGAMVELVGRPGDNNILRSVAMIAVTVAAVWVAGPAGLALSGWMYGATVAGITLAGSLAVNALIPPAAVNLPSTTGTTRGSFTGIQNQVNPYGLIPDVYGKNKIYPTIVGRPVTEVSGNDQYLRVLFALGVGDYALADLRIGDTPVSDYQDIEIAVGGLTVDSSYGGVVTANDPLSIYKRDVSEAALSDVLTSTSAQTAVTRTTATNTNEFGIDFLMPAGLHILSKKNEDRGTGVVLTIEYSPAGQNNWTSITAQPAATVLSSNIRVVTCGDNVDRVMVYGKTNDTLRAGLSFYLAAGQYDVRITPYALVTAETYYQIGIDGYGNPIFHAASISEGPWSSFGGQPWSNDHNDIIHSVEVHWTALRSWKEGLPISQDLSDNGAIVAMRIRESNQLSGMVDQFSLWATRKLRSWDGSAWAAAAATRSPAWAYVEALTGTANPRPFADSKLNLAEIQDWADWCAANGYYYDSRGDQDMPLSDLLAQVCAAGRASWAKYDGRFTVVRDTAPTIPVQMFTPRNSWGYAAQGSFPDVPHALKVTFVNENTGADDIMYVYADGYSADGANGTTAATKFETLNLPGVTNSDQVWKLGRYHIAQLILRPETHQISTDIESLRCRRGSLVRCAHDVPEWAAGWGRITGVTTDANGNVTAFASDELLVMDGVSTYAAHVRVPKARHSNWLIFSDQFDNPIWGASNATATALGGAEYKLVENSAPGVTHWISQVTGVHASAGDDITFAIKLKPGERTVAMVRFMAYGAFSVSRYMFFDLSAGTVAAGGSGIDAAIEAAQDGYYLCSITAPADLEGAVQAAVFLTIGGNNTYAGDGSSGFYMRSAQVEPAAAPTDHITTTNAPVIEQQPDTIITQQVQTVDGGTRDLTLTAAVAGIEAGQLFCLGDVVDMIVSRIDPGPDRSAKLTLVDAAPAIQDADTGPIPAFDSHITQPLTLDKIRPPTPVIIDIRSDESVLLRDSDGSTRIRAVLWFKFTVQIGLPNVQVEMRYQETGGANPYHTVGPISPASGKIDTTDVVQGQSYDFSVRSRSGAQVSDWSDPVTHVIVGKSTPPGDVSSLMAAQSGSLAVMRVSPVTDPDLGGYEFRYGPRLNTYATIDDAWDNAHLLTYGDPGTSVTTADIPPGDWRIYVKAFDTSTPKNYSVNAAYDDLNISNGNDIIIAAAQAPAWPGTLTHFVRHWTGVLVPDSTKAASDHTVPELFEQFVPYPQATCQYEAPQMDIGFNDQARIWASIIARPGRGQTTGAPAPTLEVDFHPEGDVDGNRVLKADFSDGSIGDWYVAAGVVSVVGQAFSRALKVDSRDTYENTNFVSVTPGDVLLVEGWINTLNALYPCSIGLFYLNAAGGGQAWQYGITLAIGNDWTYLSQSVAVPAGYEGYVATPCIQLDGPAGGQLGYALVGAPYIQRGFTGFRPWSIGARNLRYARTRISLDTSQGTPVISGFTSTLDALEHSEVIENIAVSAAGTAVDFGDKYHTLPRVLPQYEGAQPYMAVADNVTETGFTAYIYDLTTGNKVAATMRRAVISGV